MPGTGFAGITKFHSLIADDLLHKCIGYYIISCYELAVNRMRILLISAKITWLLALASMVR